MPSFTYLLNTIFTATGLYASLATCLPQPVAHEASFLPTRDGELWTTLHNVTVFRPGANYTSPRTLYARTERIGDTLLATWENYSPEPPPVSFPIYQSRDGGKHWTHLSSVLDTKNHYGNRYQPFLYLLPEPVGDYPAGTLLLAGNSIPTDLSSTQINVYASRDQGVSWEFVSTVASGGAAEPDNGIPAVWEPFLLYHNSHLIIYYSDQRDPLYGQKLVHQTTSDLLTWTPLVDDVHYPVYTARPGMTTVARLPTGSFIMTYEYGGGPTVANSSSYEFPVYYRISADPLSFLNSTAHPLVATDGTQPTSSPYIVWSPFTAAGTNNTSNGTLVVSSGSRTELFTNTQLGDVNSWIRVETGIRSSYSRSLRVLPDPSKLLVAGAGLLPPANNTFVGVDVIEI